MSFSIPEVNDESTQNTHIKLDPIFEKKINNLINKGEKRKYDIVIFLKKFSDNTKDFNSDVKIKKDKLAEDLVKNHSATDVYKGKVLSFVSAKIPIGEIPKISSSDSIFLIGDGEALVQSNLDVARKVISADNLNFTLNNFPVNGSGIIVSDIGTGVRQNHIDLPVDTKIINQTHCLLTGGCVRDGNYSDDDNHDTHVAGIIAGLGKSTKNMSGIASGASLLNAHLFTIIDPQTNSSNFFTDSIVKAIDWSLDNHARILNLSLGADFCGNSIIRISTEEAVDEGGVVVASNGNSGDNGLASVDDPACAFNSIGVGNYNDNNSIKISDDSIHHTSSLGPTTTSSVQRLKPELVAPGTLINSTDFCVTYSDEDVYDPINKSCTESPSPITGTSFAAPMVSGAAALLLQEHPDYTPLQVKVALLVGAKWNPFNSSTFPSSGSDYEATGLTNTDINQVGFGLLDTNRTLTLANTGKNIIQDAIGQNQVKRYSFSAIQGEQIKVILSWLKHPVGNVTNPFDEPVSNLDFTIKRSDGTAVISSNSANQNNEFAVFNAPATGLYTIAVTGTFIPSQIGGVETFALASDHAITRGSFFVKEGSFAKITSGSIQNITDTGFMPKALIMFTTGQPQTTPPFSKGYNFTIGFSDGSNSRSIGVSSDDHNATRSNAGRIFGHEILNILQAGTPTIEAQANITKFHSSGFTLNWLTNDNVPSIIHYIALGGEDISSVKVASNQTARKTGLQSFTDVGFKPDFLMFLHTASRSESGSSKNGYLSYGFASFSTRGSLAFDSVDNKGTMNTCGTQRADRAIVTLTDSKCQLDADADLATMDSNGFTLNWLDKPSSTDWFYYLAIKGGAYEIGSFQQKNGIGQQSVNTGLEPRGLILTSFNGLPSTLVQPNNRISIGATDNVAQAADWAGDKSGTGTTIDAHSTTTSKVIRLATEQTPPSSSSIDSEADIQSMNSSSFSINWSVNDLTGKQILYSAFGHSTADSGIIITENTVPNDQTVFSYTSSTLPSFQLQDAFTTGNNTKIFYNLPPGTYDITQLSNPNFITSSSCDNGSPTNSISVGVGKFVTCKFVNTKPSTIQVVEKTRPQGNTVFQFTSNTLSPSSFALYDNNTGHNSTKFKNLLAGVYNVTQTLNPNFILNATCDNGDLPSSINVGLNQTIKCTFTNSEPPSTIKIVEKTRPQNSTVFQFTSHTLLPSPFALYDNNTGHNSTTFANLLRGTYDVNQTTNPDYLTTSTCSNGNLPSSINLGSNQTVTCTFENDLRSPRGTVTWTSPTQNILVFVFCGGGPCSGAAFRNYSLNLTDSTSSSYHTTNHGILQRFTMNITSSTVSVGQPLLQAYVKINGLDIPLLSNQANVGFYDTGPINFDIPANASVGIEIVGSGDVNGGAGVINDNYILTDVIKWD